MSMSNTLWDSGIRPTIDAYLLAKSKEERDYGKYWSASSAGYCMRLNIMRRLGVPKVPELEDNATQTRIFEAGHIFHEWMQRITKDAGISIASEVELQDEKLMIRGHFDDLVLIDGKLILYDYKTQNSMAFTWQKKQPRPMSHYHSMQLGTYMYMLRTQKKADYPVPKISGNLDNRSLYDTGGLTEARILKISKDDLRMDEDQLLWTPQLEKQVVEYWTTLNGYWEAKTMPKCTCADYEGGFMARKSAKGKFYNDFFYEDEPCSLKWYEKCKAEGLLK